MVKDDVSTRFIKRKSFASVCRSTSSNRENQNKSSPEKGARNLNWAHPIRTFHITTLANPVFETTQSPELPPSTCIPQEYWDELFESAFLALNQALDD